MAPEEPEIIWANTVDNGKFAVQVIRESPRTGWLSVHTAEGDEVLTEQVGLAWGAPFGPDVDDVHQWQVRAIEVIDNWIEEHK